MKSLSRALAVCAMLAGGVVVCHATEPEVDPGFDPGVGPDGIVYAVAEDNEGRVYIGGGFQTVGGKPRTRLARLLSGGSLDPVFQVGITLNGAGAAEVYTVLPLADGRVWIGGNFDRVNGVAVTGLALLTSDGSIAPGFVPIEIRHPLFGGLISDLVLQPDGSVLAGGVFTRFGGEDRAGLGRIRPDGTVDQTFRPESLTDVNSVRVLPDGRILTIGLASEREGSMPGTGTVRYGAIRRLNPDGSLDNTFDVLASGLLGVGFAGAVRPDGLLVASVEDGGLGRNVVAWDLLGREIRTFPGGTAPACPPGIMCPPFVWPVLALPDGGAWVGGGFKSYQGRPWRGLARIDRDGRPHAGFDPGSGVDDIDGMVWALARARSGALYVAGGFSSFGGVPRRGVFRLKAPGASVPVILRQPKEVVALAGSQARLWVEVTGGPVTGFQWEKDGTPVTGATAQQLWLGTAGLIDAGLYRCRVSHAGGSVLGDPIPLRIKPRQPGFVDPGFHAGRGPSMTNLGTGLPRVRHLVPAEAGRVVIAGVFDAFNGVRRTGIARLNRDGSVDPSFAPELEAETFMGESIPAWVTGLAVDAGGRLLVCGVLCG